MTGWYMLLMTLPVIIAKSSNIQKKNAFHMRPHAFGHFIASEDPDVAYHVENVSCGI